VHRPALGIERIGGSRHPAAMPDRFPALDALIRDAEAVAAERPDVLGTLAATVARRMPAEISVEIVRLLRDRLRAQGTI
jgi:hypothetical protein